MIYCTLQSWVGSAEGQEKLLRAQDGVSQAHVDNGEVIYCTLQSWVGSAEGQEKLLRAQDGVSQAHVIQWGQ